MMTECLKWKKLGEPQTLCFSLLLAVFLQFSRDSMGSLRLKSFPQNNEEEIYVLPIKAHWTGLKGFHALKVLTSPAAHWTRFGESPLDVAGLRPNPTWLMSFFCLSLWVTACTRAFFLSPHDSQTQHSFTLSTAKWTTQNQTMWLRSHTCAWETWCRCFHVCLILVFLSFFVLILHLFIQNLHISRKTIYYTYCAFIYLFISFIAQSLIFFIAWPCFIKISTLTLIKCS